MRYDFGQLTLPIAQKEHRCEWCYGPIPKGEKHAQYKGMWDGDWQNWRMHNECYTIAIDDDALYDGFEPGCGEQPERIKALLEIV